MDKTNNTDKDRENPRQPTHSIAMDAIHLTICTVSIYVCYIGYGLLHEEIYSRRYYPNNIRFDHSLFLVFGQCTMNAFVPFVVMIFQPQKTDYVPLTDYLKIGGSYIGAMFASNVALKMVSFPTQALAKSCKLIPVMLMRIIVLRKSYPLREYLYVLMTTVGIMAFMLFQDSHKAGSQSSSWNGLGLLFISLALDGYTGPRQEKLLETYKPSVFQMMFWMNFWSFIMVFTGLIVTGDLIPSIIFCRENPEILWLMLIFTLLSALGQIVILMTVFRFDSLVLTTVTTTRKFFTILFSVLWFGHVLSLTQWICVGLVFLGLGLNTYDKYLEKKKKKQK